MSTVQGKEGGSRGEGLGWQTVKKICRCVETLDPVGWRKGCLEQKRAHNVVKGTESTLSFTVLLGCVGAGHAESNTMREEEVASGGVVKFASIVTLDTLDWATKLRCHTGKK